MLKNQVLPAVLILMVVRTCHADWMQPEDFAAVESIAGIPNRVLYSIALTESKWGKGPWPWTLNYQGRSYYFADRETLHKGIKILLSRGKTDFDVGPMQINWRYHSNLFSSTWDATDPYINVIAGAKILLERYLEHGDWIRAIAAYHSKTPHLGRMYLARFTRNHLRKGA